MKEKNSPRRDFITKVVGATAVMGLSSVIVPFSATAESKVSTNNAADAEKWFGQVTGKHKMVFDYPKPSNGAAIGWALALMDTYNDMGTPDKDLSVVIILRYAAFALAFKDDVWKKYTLGERTDLKDPETKTYAVKNLYAVCEDKDDDCLERFIKRGGMVGVCDHVVKGSSEGIAEQLKMKKEDVYKDFMDNLIPGVQLVPTGIWAVNRAQELGCTFCFGV